MRRFYTRFSIVTGFAVLLAVLIANTVVTRRELELQTRNQALVAQSREVLYELSETESLLKDAETGQRGFLYTGDPKYLAPYNSAVHQVQPHIDSLDKLTAANAREQALISELRVLSEAKLDELAKTISLYRSGQQDAARTLVLSDIGIMHMDDIRRVIDRMNQEERALAAARDAGYDASVQATVRSIYLASALAVVGLVLLAYFILHEVALRDRHASEIRAREEWFRVTLTSIGDAVIATDNKGNVTFLNPIAEKLTGRRMLPSLGRNIREVFPIFHELTNKPVEDPVAMVLHLGAVVGLANHTVVERADGALVPIEDSAAPIRDDHGRLLGVVLVFRDVTRERKAQDVMRKTEKLAAAARLSATVAHEINNPLEAVMNLVYLAMRSPDLPPDLTQTLALAEQELDRIAHLTRQTLGFYRESKTPERIEIAELIESVLKLYSNRLSNKNITVERELAPCPPIYGMGGELKQLISNLVSNAADAVSQDGRITVRLQCVEESEGTVIQVTVEDDGPGVASEDADRIFEPFFTTKEDVGTGLGLWISRQIASRHEGSIVVRTRSENASQTGAAFTVRLPANAFAEPEDGNGGDPRVERESADGAVLD